MKKDTGLNIMVFIIITTAIFVILSGIIGILEFYEVSIGYSFFAGYFSAIILGVIASYVYHSTTERREK